jgi:hypothetical protein
LHPRAPSVDTAEVIIAAGAVMGNVDADIVADTVADGEMAEESASRRS